MKMLLRVMAVQKILFRSNFISILLVLYWCHLSHNISCALLQLLPHLYSWPTYHTHKYTSNQLESVKKIPEMQVQMISIILDLTGRADTIDTVLLNHTTEINDLSAFVIGKTQFM